VDNVTHAGVSLAIGWGAMAERAKLWAYFAIGVYRHPPVESDAAQGSA
jgi:hypothetical protein